LFCATTGTAISKGDIIALDDTKIEHPMGKNYLFFAGYLIILIKNIFGA